MYLFERERRMREREKTSGRAGGRERRTPR